MYFLAESRLALALHAKQPGLPCFYKAFLQTFQPCQIVKIFIERPYLGHFSQMILLFLTIKSALPYFSCSIEDQRSLPKHVIHYGSVDYP